MIVASFLFLSLKISVMYIFLREFWLAVYVIDTVTLVDLEW